jgi:hypothetical protein
MQNANSSTPGITSISLDEFRGFFHAKAFDVIGNGEYRKHLARCKDAGDVWAIQMNAQVHAVQTCIREVQNIVYSMPCTPNKLVQICKDVMMSAQPPVRLYPGSRVCSITGKQCMRCLDLSKSHKASKAVFVDLRFCQFFMFLWFCNKLEYIVRSYTRTWMDAHSSDFLSKTSTKDLCEALQAEMEPLVGNMFRFFGVARTHVHNTLVTYLRHDMQRDVLVHANV